MSFENIENKEFFFIIDPYVYYLSKPGEVFLYNTLTQKYMETKEKSIVNFLGDIQEGKNLSVKKISGNKLIKNPPLKTFLLKLREGFFGDLIELKEGEVPPIQLYPILGLKKRETGEFDFSDDQNPLGYLTSLNIHLNNRCHQNCPQCQSAYKQFFHCSKFGDEPEEIDEARLTELLKYLKGYPNVQLSFSGGNIFLYSKIAGMLNLVKSAKNRKNFLIHYKNIIENLENLNIFSDEKVSVNVLVDGYMDPSDLNRIHLKAMDFKVNIRYRFSVSSESEIEKINEIVSKTRIANYSIRPLYNGKNKTFFKKHVFFNKTQMLEQELSIKDIFFNKVFNKHFLGTVNLLNNGDYYINLNKKTSGNIKTEYINDIINNELFKNGDWFLTRDQVVPCKDCNFASLCPAISNYEFALGQYNLCKFNPMKKKDQMIDKIKEKLWTFLREKKISLVMIFDNTGDIIWYKGRSVRGNNIATSDGFAKSYILECMRSLKEISQDNVTTIESSGDLSMSALRLFLKSVVVMPLDHNYFLYFDSGTKKGFSQADISFIKTIAGLLKDTISTIEGKCQGENGICSISEKMEAVRKKVLKYSFNTEPVLFLGETGVGKTFIAEFIHKYSGRKGKFVNADITTMNENLFESTFFGHKKGAFTDARENKKGLVEEAEGGTLFIDEISEIPISFQSKLLKFIDTKSYRVLGETGERVADIRIVAATNKNLNRLIEDKEFKNDLYYRISIFEITIPPLRERKEDIRFFIENHQDLLNGKTLGENFFDEVVKYNWPGNFRELKTMLRRAGVLLDSPITGAKIKNIINEFNHIKLENSSGTKTEKIWGEILSGRSFWEAVKQPYLSRDLNRHEVNEIIEKGLSQSNRSYKNLIGLFNIDPDEYKKFMNFLTVHKLSN